LAKLLFYGKNIVFREKNNKNMYKISIVIIGLLVFQQTGYSQISIKKIINSANQKLGEGNLSNDEIIGGLKEALNKGVDYAVSAASKTDGFNKNQIIRIPFPEEAVEMEKKLRAMGMSKQVDEFIISLNRAAEDAAKSALPVFGDAVTNMSIDDGMKILKGADDAATNYLRETSSSKLNTNFKPIIKKSLETVDVTKYWTPLASTYNKIPFVKKQNPDLDAYVTERAISGLFTLVAAEEKKIRQDPAARTTELLSKVFGSNE
jgi:uncharacterized protein DUF4197